MAPAPANHSQREDDNGNDHETEPRLLRRRNADATKRAIVIELKYDKTADTAIDQIRRRDYPQKVAACTSDMLLVGISYDRDTKQHQCKIERMII